MDSNPSSFNKKHYIISLSLLEGRNFYLFVSYEYNIDNN